MANRLPIVLIDGQLHELPDNDTLLGSSAFLDLPDNVEESLSTYYYYGWQNVSGGWLIQRQSIADGLSESATISNNSTFALFTNAWDSKTSLVYN